VSVSQGVLEQLVPHIFLQDDLPLHNHIRQVFDEKMVSDLVALNVVEHHPYAVVPRLREDFINDLYHVPLNGFVFLKALDKLVILVLGEAQALPACYCGACLEEAGVLLTIYSDRADNISENFIPVAADLAFEFHGVVVLDRGQLLELLRHLSVYLAHENIMIGVGDNEDKP